MKNSILVTLVGFVLLASFSGCKTPNPFSGGGKDTENAFAGTANAKTFEEGQQAYLNGDYTTASRKMGVYAAAFPTTAKGIEAKYWQAMSLNFSGQTSRARNMLADVKASSLAPVSLKAMSQQGIAKSYALENKYVMAESSYNELLSTYPGECDHAEVLSSLEQCARLNGNVSTAARYRQKLSAKNPDSAYLKTPPPSLTRRSVNRSELYTVQVGVFSTKRRALDMVSKLHRRGIEAVSVHENGRYVVRAGSFSSKDRAARQLAKVKSSGFPAIIK
jgi:hypothetical protein